VSPSLAQTDATSWLRRHSKGIKEHTELAVTEEVASATEVEAWLQRRGVKYAPPTGIPMTMIEERRSRANQARKDPIVAESVERFATAFRAGKSFPPIVVYSIGNKLVIIDGNNRHEAAKRAKREHIYGIVIDPTTDGDLIQLLTVEANATHGVTPPLEWRIKQALHLMTLGHPEALAAEASGVTGLQMRNARSASEADARARALRVQGFSDLSASVKVMLNPIKNEPVFHAVAKLAATQGFGVETARDITRAVKAGKSEAEQLAIVAEKANEYDVEDAIKKAMKRGPSSPKNALASACGLFQKCDTSALVRQIMTVHDRDVIKSRLEEAADKILEIQVAMEELDELEDE
jgi:CBS domain-containing protein